MTSVRRTRRWRGIVAVALAAAALGLVFKRPFVLLLSVVGVAFAAYPQVPSPPQVTLGLERVLDDEDPDHGDEVEVTVRLHNEGTRTLTDLRVVDGVPPMLAVSDGTPRHATALPPGADTSFSYTVTAEHGSHSFEPATVIARDLAGATEVETTVPSETTIECVEDVPEIPLRRQTSAFVGQLVTDEGGSGVEFHRTREYHPGDALARIDWRRYAKTGELGTVEFREERGATVVLCVDSREPAYRTPREGDPHGVAYARAAAEQLLVALADTPYSVGIATLGDREQCWLDPGSGSAHVDRARRLLGTHPALSSYPPDRTGPDHWDEQLTALRRRLAPDTQVYLLSPLSDEFAADAAITVEASGHAVTVLSPDVTNGETVGGRLARTERHNRIHSLRESGVRAVDWTPTDSLGSVLVRAQEGWSR